MLRKAFRSLEHGIENFLSEGLVDGLGAVAAVDVLDEGGKTGTTDHHASLHDRKTRLLVFVAGNLVVHEVYTQSKQYQISHQFSLE